MSENRFMYHSFPRRKNGDQTNERGLAILRLIVEHGLLLTPELETWRDRKLDRSEPEEIFVASKRCCFTEIAEDELARHAEYFGAFALEFETRVLCDLGAMPVFYIPRTTDSDGYGVGAAIVTQLAHVQELAERVNAFRQFAMAAGGPHPDAPVLVRRDHDGNLLIGVPNGPVLTIPKEILDRAAKNPSFRLEVGENLVPLGMSAGTLLSLFNVLTWGIHVPDVLVGAIQSLGSLFYSTERIDDPFLSHYRQREWRIIGNMKKDGVELTKPVGSELRAELIALDSDFFGKKLPFRTGPAARVDQTQVFGETQLGKHVSKCLRRIIVPSDVLAAAVKITKHLGVEVVSTESIV